MTSKRLFFKVMREDMRHRIWMVALSVLGSFLAVLVAWLLWESNVPTFLVDQNGMYVKTTPQLLADIAEFFSRYLTVMGGILTIAGALIAGLFGFRYIFHKNTVDTYHSLPVKRDVLFGAVYLNGVLIWFVPFLLFLLTVLVKAGFFWNSLGGTGKDVAVLWKEAALTLAVLILVYLLVYNLVLVAAMFSGNVLNTLVSMMILGFSAISIWGMCHVFFQAYFDFFYYAGNWKPVAYGTPLFAAPLLLTCRYELKNGGGNFWEICGKPMLCVFLAAVLLGVCAWLLYRRRASELAEQGVRNRPAAFLMRLAASVVAGMGGWIIFTAAFYNGQETGWGIFGAVFGTVLVFGVLDIIFHMEFKAFFVHRLQMALTVAGLLLVCFAIRWDWFGYDRYLPARDKIAEIAVWGNFLSSHYRSPDGEDSPLDRMSIRDVDAIYAYLERMTEDSGDAEEYGDRYADSIVTKVTLTNGKSYYRRYRSGASDVDVLLPLIATQEYVKEAYCVGEEAAQNITKFALFRSGERLQGSVLPETAADIVRAYNADVLEDPEGVVSGRGTMLVRIELTSRKEDGYSESYRMSVYDTMEHTVEALRQAGLAEWVSEEEASNVRSIALNLNCYIESASPEETIDLARTVYGVYLPEEKDPDSGDIPVDKEAVSTRADVPDRSWVEVTDPAEVEELFALIHYAQPYYRNSLVNTGVEISYTDADGNTVECYFPRGVLPEKYILRFGALFLGE